MVNAVILQSHLTSNQVYNTAVSLMLTSHYWKNNFSQSTQVKGCNSFIRIEFLCNIQAAKSLVLGSSSHSSFYRVHLSLTGLWSPFSPCGDQQNIGNTKASWPTGQSYHFILLEFQVQVFQALRIFNYFIKLYLVKQGQQIKLISQAKSHQVVVAAQSAMVERLLSLAGLCRKYH